MRKALPQAVYTVPLYGHPQFTHCIACTIGAGKAEFSARVNVYYDYIKHLHGTSLQRKTFPEGDDPGRREKAALMLHH